MNTTKIVELVIDEDSQELAIDAISLVSAPAIEENWVFFGKEKNNLTFAKVDEEKRMLISPALIPNKQIFRYDPNTDSDYYVYFSPETVRQASELYLKNNNHHKATQEHSERVSGVLTVESWIIEDTKTDKSTLYGFSLPKGTWMVKMKIENEDLWQKIKSGELKGLSIEGYFTNKFEQMQKKEPTPQQILSALNKMIQSKTELKAEKVELGSVAELKDRAKKLLKALSDADKSWRTYQDYLTGADKPYVKMIDAYGELDPAVSFAEGTLKRFEKAAKELGVKATDNKDFNNLEADIKESKKMFNIINSFKDPSNFQ
jgi:hypothetical protein